MPVFRAEHKRNYTVMDNRHLKDKALSLKAKGLLSMMLSFPEEWNFSVRGLAAVCKEGRDAIRSTLGELEAAGYLRRRQVRGPGGRIMDTEYIIYETAMSREDDGPGAAGPCPAGPGPDDPGPENPTGLNIDISTTEISNTDTASTQSFRPGAPAGARDGGADGSQRREEICERIEYEVLRTMYRREELDELVELMVEVDMNQSPTLRLGRDGAYPAAYVRRRFAMLGREHVEKVLDGIRENAALVKNTKAYLLSALFNAAATLDHHYTMRVNHDLYGEG